MTPNPTSEISLVRVFESVLRSEGKLDSIAARLDRVENEAAATRTRVEALERSQSEAAGKAANAATVRAAIISTTLAVASGVLFPWFRGLLGQ